jgi:hypothetical protein
MSNFTSSRPKKSFLGGKNVMPNSIEIKERNKVFMVSFAYVPKEAFYNECIIGDNDTRLF